MTIDDVVIFLDTRGGRYYAVRGADALRWRAAHGPEQLQAKPVDRQQLTGWHGYRGPAFVVAWCINRRVRQLLKTGRLGALYAGAAALVSQRSNGFAADAQAQVARLDKDLQWFLLAEALFDSKDPSRDCLARSFSLFVFLTLRHHTVGHRIGVITEPLMAHAWVVHGARVLVDNFAESKPWRLISSL